MQRYRLNELPDRRDGHFMNGLVNGDFIDYGALSFREPGSRSHTSDGPGGQDRHVHLDRDEVFMILQGRGAVEVDGVRHAVVTGDVVVAAAGEDHHLIADADDPCVVVWFRTAPERP